MNATSIKNNYSFENLSRFNVIELKENEIAKTEGGVWGFIGPMAYLMLGTACLGAFAAGVVVGYVGYKIYHTIQNSKLSK